MQVTQYLLFRNEQNRLGKNEDESRIALAVYAFMLLHLTCHGKYYNQ